MVSSDDSENVDTEVAPPQIARNVGANMLVTGTVQGSADQLRITVKLDNVAENKVLWNDEFSGVPGDLLTIEDKIYGKLAEVLETNVSAGDIAAERLVQRITWMHMIHICEAATRCAGK